MPEEDDQPAPLPEAAPPRREHVGPDYHIKDDKSHKGLIFLIVFVLLLAGGGAAWFLTQHKKTKPTASTTNSARAEATIDTKSKTYTSPNFYLTFTYPADWTISDSGGNSLSVISPALQLKSAAGQTVTGQIEMLIRNGTAKLNEFNAGNATAVFDSQKITYTNPTQTQRAQTFLSFLQYASSSAGLDGLYITGDNGYTKGQAIPEVDISKGDPIISVIFDKCAGSACSGQTTPLSISEASWQDSSFSGPLLKMLQSLSIT